MWEDTTFYVTFNTKLKDSTTEREHDGEPVLTLESFSYHEPLMKND